jgi:hypothetical protein
VTTSAAQTEGSAGVLGQGPGYVFTGHQNVLIASWTAQGTGPLIDALGRTLSAFIAQHPEGVSTVHLIAGGLPLADAAARAALGVLMKRHAGALACNGTVLGGTGFWASATRSMMVGFQLIAPSTYAMRTCATISEVVAWMPKPHVQRTGVVLVPQAFERAIEQARDLK